MRAKPSLGLIAIMGLVNQLADIASPVPQMCRRRNSKLPAHLRNKAARAEETSATLMSAAEEKRLRKQQKRLRGICGHEH